MSKKLHLKEIKVKSFVTNLENQETNQVKAGGISPTYSPSCVQICSDTNCPGACTNMTCKTCLNSCYGTCGQTCGLSCAGGTCLVSCETICPDCFPNPTTTPMA
jgi:hypothetical protein